MENEMKNYGILIGLIFGLAIAIFVVGVLFATGTISFKTNTTSDNEQSNKVGDINNYEDNAYDYIETTADRVRLNTTQDYYDYAEITIENGDLVVQTSRYNRDIVNDTGVEIKDESYDGTTKTFSIDGEKAKYITSIYYQPGITTTILVLTESGNIYGNSIVAMDKTIDAIDDFKKTEYSHVKGLVKIDNSNSTEPDRVPYYFGAVIDGEVVTVSYNWE